MPKELIENTDWGKLGLSIYIFANVLDMINKDILTWAIGILAGMFTICYYAIKIYSEWLTIKEKKKKKDGN